MYDKPNKYIDTFGKNLYTYVTSLHVDNLFNFPQLLVLAYSLIKTGSIADRICIVSDEITDEYINTLEMFYKIIKFDGKINNRYLKYYALNLTNYKKILIINPNFVILQNPDILFMTHAPGAYFKSSNYISTDLLLLEPKENDFDAMTTETTQSLIGLDEADYIYNRYYSNRWNRISEYYLYDKTNIINIDKVKYIRYEVSPVNIIFADVHKDDIYLIWYDIYKDLLYKFPDLIENKHLKGTNNILTQYMKNVLKRPEANIETDIVNLKNIYDSNEIHISLQKYYHIQKDIESKIDFEPMFENINNIDEPITKLREIYNSDYLKKPVNDDNKDTMYLLYLKSKKNIGYKIIKENETNTIQDVYFTKTLQLTKKMYSNLLFFIQRNKTYENRIKDIENIDFDEGNYTFVFHKENGSNSVDVGEIIFNDNNLELMKTINIQDITVPFMNTNLLYIHTLRNWINANLSNIEKERFILFGDIVLGTNGIKKINKIEGVFVSVGNDSSEYEKNLENLITENLCKKTGFHFTKITKENSQEYNKYHKFVFDKIRKEKSIDFVLNSDNYYNFYGLKILTFDLNIHYIESQKDIDVKTDVIMTNIINNQLISRFVSYDANKRILKTNKKFKLNDKEIDKIKKNANNKYTKFHINRLL